MFNRKKQPAIKSLVAEGSQIDGHFTFSDGLRLDGSLTGNVTGLADRPSILVISESAVVTGAVQADHIIINGRVDGPVHARVMLELQPKARITGDVSYKLLEMHQGATVAGRLCPLVGGQLGQDAEEKPTLKLAANNQ
ncbi:MAG: polymer-forming cytoskeletal protein [Rhodoferax sp.]|nr:polymer-forming cytoskeletal protein [Betaproteobacteria bacterium]NCN96609.1 polymer-forming cytoskeletal protein [Rhodoferax sp.]OIP13876.1 MAG: cell shape determination protein CcmA [Comamonadaceae bacterium CG2_30_57_122]PIZ24000.1 MAG: cell shape determination protein CcmA [Comamonadaceae bacterium CG_4_10_14_0_8_um_filter_57_29]PJC23055.1 MAG: cell shape determination protein CcmA [Comamonadaceae bacterium CG_4_9_14_0_8_um_filter_57_21]